MGEMKPTRCGSTRRRVLVAAIVPVLLDLARTGPIGLEEIILYILRTGGINTRSDGGLDETPLT